MIEAVVCMQRVGTRLAFSVRELFFLSISSQDLILLSLSPPLHLLIHVGPGLCAAPFYHKVSRLLNASNTLPHLNEVSVRTISNMCKAIYLVFGRPDPHRSFWVELVP